MKSFLQIQGFLFLGLLLFPSLVFSKSIKLTILHTNDHHGRYWKNRKNEYGMAARKTLIDKIRAEVKSKGGHVLLLSGGDINTGTPESDLLDAEPDFKGMNELGYDAMALGNHEFDKPFRVLKKQQKWAKFPFLAANIFDSSTGRRAFKPYITKKIGGLNISIIGFTTKDTNLFTSVKEVQIRDSIQESKVIIPKLKEKSDFIIAVTHLGHYPKGLHGLNSPGDVALAKATKGNIDVIVGGHTQKPLYRPDRIGNTLILQAYEWGKYVGRLDLIINKNKYKVLNYQFIPVNLKKSRVKNPYGHLAENSKMISLLKPFKNKLQGVLSKRIGTADGWFYGRAKGKEIGETNLGRAIAKSVCESTKAEICFTNNGGLRADLPKGSITYGKVLEILPFGNTLCSFKIRGKSLIKYLNTILHITRGSPAHFSGLKMQIKNGKVFDLKVNQFQGQGTHLMNQGRIGNRVKSVFKIASSCFLTSGKDNYPKMVRERGYLDTGISDAKAFRDMIIKYKTLKESDFSTPNYQR